MPREQPVLGTTSRVTVASNPPETLDRPRAEAESLSDLVDFAIDANTGVVESPAGDSFFVVTDECLVTYEPPSVPGGVRADERPASTGDVTSGSTNGGSTAEQADPGDD
ncbi:hypothetical protein SAMN04487948_105289 [Halogranum amylolyticum]|uniref:Halobacterial output domain-containing protein n=1 Tax=Halogranum amylolyticum TaxID=660520 RepID=A0A1H8SS47_9EURY|nr:DUF5305 family protein [Halogranum amylolyticum]SEO81417.1 hypothetical protein SAMN04487948_105289 [Halogranum amylolyticum]